MHASDVHVIEMQERTEQLFEQLCECLCGQGLEKQFRHACNCAASVSTYRKLTGDYSAEVGEWC